MTQLYIDPFGPPWKLHSMRLIFRQWKGSIFQFFWVEWLTATALCAVSLTIWYLVYKNGVISDNSPAIAGLFSAMDYIVTRFQAALSLMLGFYTSTIYGRWWTVRDKEGLVIGRINDIAPQIAAMVRDNDGPCQKQRDRRNGGSEGETDEKRIEESTVSRVDETEAVDAGQVRMHLIRWLNLAHALGVGELYEKKPNEFSNLNCLLEMGLLTDKEYGYMVKNSRSRYVAPFVWFLDLLQQLKEREKCGISESTVIVMAENITKIRGSLADLYMYRNIPVPLSYRQLVNVTVRMYMVMLAIAGGLSAVERVEITRDEIWINVSKTVFWFLLPFFFEYFMFVGWLSLADALGNPFRVWADEFEWENYVRSVFLSSKLFVTESRTASPSVSDLPGMTSSCMQKLSNMEAEWTRRLGSQEESHIKTHGLKEALTNPDKEKAAEGFAKFRYDLTGF